MLVSILQCSGPMPSQRSIWPQTSVVPGLGNLHTVSIVEFCVLLLSQVAESRLLIAVASLVAEYGSRGHRLQAVVARDLSSRSSQALRHGFNHRGARA